MHLDSFPARTVTLVVLAILLCSAASVQAATIGLYGKPELSATITGSNELDPGTDSCITVLLRNHGRDPEIISNPAILPGAIDPVTAIGVEAALLPGDAPVTVRSTVQPGGDLPAGEEALLQFCLTTDEKAEKGTYLLDLVCIYRYAWASDILTPESMQYYYREEEVHIPLEVDVAGLVRPAVLSVSGENLYPGREGALVVELYNSGKDTGYSSYAAIVPDPAGPVRVIDGTDMVGTFAPGDRVAARFRLSIDNAVGNGTFPADVVVIYKDEHGNEKTSRSVPVGIAVSRGPKFAIVSPSPVLAPGQTLNVPLVIGNTGDGPAYRVSTRVIQSSIITTENSMIALGTLEPGTSAGGEISLTANTNAIPKSYALTTMVKYYDEFGNLQLSDPMVLEVIVEQPTTFSLLSFSLKPEIPLTIAAVIIIVVYAAFMWRKHKKRDEMKK